MSVVTGVMLILGAGDWDEEPIAEVHAWRAPGNLVLILQPEEGPTRIFLQKRPYEGIPQVHEMAVAQ